MKRPEQEIQKAILHFIRVQYPAAIVFHIPNGGARTKIEAAILKGQGVRPGVADLCVLWANGGVGFLEVKADNGRLSMVQVVFAYDCYKLGIPWACVRSVDEAQDALKAWGCA